MMAVPDDAPEPFRDPNLPTAARISDLVALLTLDERIGLLSTNFGIPRLGIPGVENIEGNHGLSEGMEALDRQSLTPRAGAVDPSGVRGPHSR